MKSVLLSIKPKYCKLIASGKKTVDIRKNRPKIDAPFKCYIYCTLNGTNEIPMEEYFAGKWHKKKGKVIGEFICDRITFLGAITTAEWKYLAGDAHEYHKKMVTEYACLSEAEVLKYGNGKSCYAWHISDLVIYDKPKELSEFLKYNRTEDDCYCQHLRKPNSCRECMRCALERPPQNWCYVEELEETT